MKKQVLALITLGAFTLCWTLSGAFAADIDLSKSSLDWHGTKITGKHDGRISFKSGSVNLKDGKLVGGDFVVDMQTISITDLTGEWKKKFIAHISGPDFFIISKYPTSKLKIKSVKNGNAIADLTIKDKTQEVKFKLIQKGNTYSGLLEFDRTKFGMIYGSGDFFKGLGDKVVHNEVKVNFKFVVKK